LAIKVKRALVSVSNKKGITGFAQVLQRIGVEIISTGGTYNKLKEAKIKVIKAEEVTGFPEMLGGRVKTLHPYIHGAILADRSSKNHMDEISKLGIKLIDMVVVNLYPFKETISKEGVSTEEAVENIDIGGPTMIRSAAKNYRGVAAVVDPEDYEKITEELIESNGFISDSSLFSLSVKAFQHTCEYDSVIFNYFMGKDKDFRGSAVFIRPYLEINSEQFKDKTGEGKEKLSDEIGKNRENIFRDNNGKFNDALNPTFTKVQNLRYGENPHQKAAYYKLLGAGEDSFANCKQLQGKELSYNNILDSDAAFGIVKEFNTPCVSVIKHSNPCGAAAAESVLEAYKRAYQCDPVSAFGSIVACNVKWTAEASKFLIDKYVEVLIAPDFEPEALKILSQKQNLRVLEVNFDSRSYISKFKSRDFTPGYVFRSVDGGMLLQDLDEGIDSVKSMRVVTNAKPDDDQWDSLLFGWQIAKNVKSNAIVLSSGRKTVGVGAGQMSRIDAAKIAVEKAGSRCKGSVLASDAFFPFEDVVELAVKNAVTSIIQPGGSVRDDEVIKCCNRNKISMVFTGKRHFKH